jgi:hypothetical protein
MLTLAVNVAQGWTYGLVGAVVAARPAVALAVALALALAGSYFTFITGAGFTQR